MINYINRKSLQMSAAFITGIVSANPAFATDGGSSNNFTSIARTITTSISGVPGLLSGLAYMFGILLGVLGVLKIKDHVENPTQTALKDGAIRLAAGGGLFALPMIYEAMLNTVGSGSGDVGAAVLNAVSFQTQ